MNAEQPPTGPAGDNAAHPTPASDSADPIVLRFLGGAATVTGSRFLIDYGDSRTLVDCGLFQGLKRDRLRNWDPFPVDPATIDQVVITHGHIDHSGYVPALVERGFKGRVIATHRTVELCRILLTDAAHLQEEEARYANRKGYSKHHPALPLFTTEAVNRSLALFEGHDFDDVIEVGPDVTCRLLPAGHILGSASVYLEIGRAAATRRILISGDLGRGDHPLLGEPASPPPADVVLVESTYGNRNHPADGPEFDQVADAITEAASRGGIVLIPAFAVDRTEVVMALLDELERAGRIPQLPVFIDSPMAQRVLAVYRAAVAAGDRDVRPGASIHGFMHPDRVRECRTPESSKALADLTYPSVIISASGMATGGRVLHHLSRLLPDDRNVVILAGFQAAGTRGRSLAEGARTVKIHGHHVPVRAGVVALSSLSVHADSDELLAWVGGIGGPPEIVYAVHGETEASEALATRIGDELGLAAVCPRHDERVLLS